MTPPTRRLRRRARRSSVGVKFKTDTVRPDQRHPLLQGVAPTPARTSAASGLRAASCSPRRRSPARAPPAGRRSPSRARSRSLPNTTYVAGYFAPIGHYSATSSYFYPPPAPNAARRSSLDSAPLHALGNNNAAGGNGVFAYASSSTFPTQQLRRTNYWVDVVCSPGTSAGSGRRTCQRDGGHGSARR